MLWREIMHIYVYSDESGVFDKTHNDYFVFAGIICFSKIEKDNWSRKYSFVEKSLRNNSGLGNNIELKACVLSNKQKSSLFRSLNSYRKFAVIVKQKEVLDSIFYNKKSKQRYLDFVYKMAVKNALQSAIDNKNLISSDVNHLHFFVDEHSTATNGKYELRESLEAEFKYGTHNWNYNIFFPPLFDRLSTVDLKFCNSKQYYLVRASDIIANRIYYLANNNKFDDIYKIRNLDIITQP